MPYQPSGLIVTSLLLFCFISFQTVLAQNAEVLLFETNLSVKGDQLEENVHLVIRINNRNGEDYNTLHIPYSENDRIKSFEAWIEDAAGERIKKLKPKDIRDRNAFLSMTFHDDFHYRYFTLTHSEYPYTIHLDYTIKRLKFLHIANWDAAYYSDIPTNAARLTLTTPIDYEVRIDSRDMNEPVVTHIDETIRYLWTSHYLIPFVKEPMAPPEHDLLPYVNIVPVNFVYGPPGQFNSWNSFGKWEYQLLEGLDQLTTEEANKVRELISGVNAPLEKAKILYRYLQENTRYVNISIDIGGLKPYPASYVARNKYGDCKALTNYMKALLKEAGIQSYYTSVYAGDIPVQIKKDFPSQQFNHVVLLVPLNQDSIWLECTSNTTPFGYAGTFIQNRDAFVIKKDSSCFVKIPPLDSNGVSENYTTRIRCDEKAACHASAHFTVRGDQYERLAYMSKHSDAHDQKEFIRDFITFRDFEVGDWDIFTDPHGKAEAEVELDYQLLHFLKTQPGLIYGSLPPLNTALFSLKKERKHPLVLAAPVNISDSLIFEYPATLTPRIRENKSVKSDYGYYQLYYHLLDNGNMVITRKLLIHPGRFEVDQYQEFKAFLDEIRSVESKNPIVFNK